MILQMSQSTLSTKYTKRLTQEQALKTHSYFYQPLRLILEGHSLQRNMILGHLEVLVISRIHRSWESTREDQYLAKRVCIAKAVLIMEVKKRRGIWMIQGRIVMTREVILDL